MSRWPATCLSRITISLSFANSEFTFADNLRLNNYVGTQMRFLSYRSFCLPASPRGMP
jgi:hypothetical protein